MLYCSLLHQVVEDSVHCPHLWFVELGDGPKHHGCRRHVFSRVEEVLCPVTALSKLVVDLCRPRSFDLEAFPLDVVVKSIKLTDMGVELFLLLPERVLTSEDTCLALALVVLLLVGGFIIPRRCHFVVVLPRSRPSLVLRQHRS